MNCTLFYPRAIAVTARRDESLYQNTDGAIMVMGAFMAMFLVGMLYFCVGIGNTILFRERMQDASDAAAFSAAVMNARGMNLIALINIIMAALLAILVALRAVELLCIAAIAIATAMAWITGGASLGAIPPLRATQTAINRAYNAAKRVVDPLLRLGHKAGVAVREGMPYVAQGKAIVITMTAYRPPAQIGFALMQMKLPTEDAPFSELCNKAAEYVAHVIEIPLRPLVTLPVVGDWIRGAVRGFTRLAASTVCGGSGSMDLELPEQLGGALTYDLPETENMRRCRTDGNTAACEAAQEEMKAQRYGPDGYCRNGIPEGARQTDCEARISNAWSVCRPRSGGSPRLLRYTYQVADMIQPVSWNPDTRSFAFGIPRMSGSPRVETTSRPLCGTGGSISTDYGPGIGRTGMGTPVCQTPREQIERDPRVQALPYQPPGTVVEIPFRRVLQVLGCRAEMERPSSELGNTISGGNDKSPQRVQQGVLLGDEEFQIRGFVIGRTDWDRDYRGVRAANNWQDAGDTELFRNLRELGRLSVAQAEFYYAGPETDPGEWLWHMSWRARLRRFRMPPSLSGDSGALQQACNASNSGGGGGGGGGCRDASGFDLGFLERVIIH